MPTVGEIIGQCDTSLVAGLSSQIIGEIQVLEPTVFVPFNDLNVTTNSARLFLQADAKRALQQAIQARGVKMRVNSAYRTCAQQYILFEEYRQGQCGIRLAAHPGKSDHEDALAIDIEGHMAWKPFLLAEGWKWQGSSDPVHFSYLHGRSDIGNVGVKAFQRLWNRHHPNDRITEDGVYGQETEKRLKSVPTSGF